MDSKPPGFHSKMPEHQVSRLKELWRRYARVSRRLREIQEAKKKRRPHVRLIRFDKQKAPGPRSRTTLSTNTCCLKHPNGQDQIQLRCLTTGAPRPRETKSRKTDPCISLTVCFQSVTHNRFTCSPSQSGPGAFREA